MDIADEILVKLLNRISQSAMTIVDMVVRETLAKYDVTPKKNAVIEFNHDGEKDKEEFIARKYAGGITKGTMKLYLSTINRSISYHGNDLRNVSDKDIVSYIIRREQVDKKEKVTIENERKHLHVFFEYQKDTEKIRRNPVDLVPKIKFTPNERRPLTAYEQSQLYDALMQEKGRAKDRDCAIVFMLVSAGLRVTELCNLDMSDIDFHNRSIHVRHGNGDKARTTYFDAATEFYLKKYINSRKDHNVALFINCCRNTNRVIKETVEHLVSKAGYAAGIYDKVIPYRLRHTCATNAIEHRISIPSIQKMLGHASPETTEIYAKLSSRNLEDEYRVCMG